MHSFKNGQVHCRLGLIKPHHFANGVIVTVVPLPVHGRVTRADPLTHRDEDLGVSFRMLLEIVREGPALVGVL